MAARISGGGFVTVSDRRSIISRNAVPLGWRDDGTKAGNNTPRLVVPSFPRSLIPWFPCSPCFTASLRYLRHRQLHHRRALAVPDRVSPQAVKVRADARLRLEERA